MKSPLYVCRYALILIFDWMNSKRFVVWCSGKGVEYF